MVTTGMRNTRRYRTGNHGAVGRHAQGPHTYVVMYQWKTGAARPGNRGVLWHA